MGQETQAVRVVLDTNVVVSALLFERDRLDWIRDLWSEGRIVPLCSQETIEELIRVLAYPKFDLGEEDIEAILAAYLPFAETVVVPGSSGVRLPRCRDPHDQKFLGLADAGQARVLVSGDRALLDLGGRLPFDIEAPERFRTRFG